MKLNMVSIQIVGESKDGSLFIQDTNLRYYHHLKLIYSVRLGTNAGHQETTEEGIPLCLV